jgi:hypothetical protein
VLPSLLAIFPLTPAFATTYTRAPDRAPVIENMHVGGRAAPSPQTGQAQSWGATFDNLSGKFTAAPSATGELGDDCGSADCSAAAGAVAPLVQTANRQAPRPAAVAPPAHSDGPAVAGTPAAGKPPVTTADTASADWYTNTLMSDAYSYNGNNDAFLIDGAGSYLPPMPDFNSWGMMFGGAIAMFLLMRRAPKETVTEPDAVEQAWGGPETRALELRAPTMILKGKKMTPVPALCCSRQALPGS